MNAKVVVVIPTYNEAENLPDGPPDGTASSPPRSRPRTTT